MTGPDSSWQKLAPPASVTLLVNQQCPACASAHIDDMLRRGATFKDHVGMGAVHSPDFGALH